jgi:predicted Zn finger-like uncharacterized protein
MIVTCPSCSARYKLDDSKITGRGARITCPRCRHVFVVFPAGTAKAEVVEEETARNKAVAAGGGPSLKIVNAPFVGVAKPKRSATDLDFRKVGIPSWKVKVKIGLVYDFSDIKTLRKYIQDGRVTPEDAISHDGKVWKTIGDIPDLDTYFVDIYDEAEARRAAMKPDSNFEDESPTTIVGMGSLGRNLASEALRQATEEALLEASQPGGGAGHTATGSRATAGATEANPFVDPFAALKDRQRERIKARRKGSSFEAKKAKEKRASHTRYLMFGLVLVGLGGVWWVTGPTDLGSNPAMVPPGKSEADKARAIQKRQEQIAEVLRQQIEDQLTIVDEPKPEDEEPERRLTPVIPPGEGPNSTTRRVVVPGGQTPNGLNPTPGSQQFAGSLTTAKDHVDTAWDAIRRSDWNTAYQACRSAKRLDPRDPKVLMVCGAAQFHKGQIEPASRDIGAAEASGLRDSRLKKYQCWVAEAQGDIAGAVGFCRAYLATGPADAANIQAYIDDMTGG